MDFTGGSRPRPVTIYDAALPLVPALMNAPARYLLVALPVCGLLAATACEGRLAYRFDEPRKTAYTIPEGTHTLRVEVPWGAMTFAPNDGDEVVTQTMTRRAADTEEGLEALLAIDVAPRIVEAEPGVLALRGPEVPEELDPVAHRMITLCEIFVPSGLAVEGKTGFGAMAAHDLQSGVALTTGKSDIFVKGCAGAAVLRTGEGAVLVDKHRGSVDAESIECQTMQIFVDELRQPGLRLITKRGGIQAHVPVDASFVLNAHTNLGKARNSFGIPVEKLPPNGEAKRMAGAVGDGGPEVILDARGEGHVSIRGLKKEKE